MRVNNYSFARLLAESFTRLMHALYLPPAVLFLSIMVVTVMGWQAAQTALDHDIQRGVKTRIASLEASLAGQLSAYEQILRGGVGLFQASNDDVTYNEFANYLMAYDLAGSYPGVQSIGYARVLTPDQLDGFKNELAAQGITSFDLRPGPPPKDAPPPPPASIGQPSRRPLPERFAPITYVQAVATDSLYPGLGYDMYSQIDRRLAMFTAQNTGEATITKRIEFRSEDTNTPPVGFNMYIPIYGSTTPQTVADRKSNIQGYIYGSFRTAVFLQKASIDTDSQTIGFRIVVDGDAPTKPLYQSDNFTAIQETGGAVTISRSFSAYNQTWHITYALDPSRVVSNVQLRRPGGLLFFGLFSAVLVSGIVYLLLRTRSQALVAQKERDVELAKEELLSLASHQLRTPATGVKQYLGMVLQGFAGPVPDEQRPLLEKAYASNDRQLQAINEILHMAKIDSGRIVLARQETVLNDLLKDVVNEQRPDIEIAKHHIEFRLPRRPIVLFVDTHMLHMAIENLLSNAIKYTPQGGRITVTMSKDPKNVNISVSDNGVGIAENDFGKLFKQFTRLPNEMSQRVGGTGVGLYLAKHLVALHHGSMRVQSAPGVGSTFTITLPIAPNAVKDKH